MRSFGYISCISKILVLLFTFNGNISNAQSTSGPCDESFQYELDLSDLPTATTRNLASSLAFLPPNISSLFVAVTGSNITLNTGTYSQGNGYTAGSGKIIYCNNTFYVDVDLTISYSTIVFGRTGKIIVQSGKKLTIAGCWLQTCGDFLWEGIYLEPGAKIEIHNGTLVEDAKIAISAQENCLVQLLESNFNKCYKSVVYNFNNQSFPLNSYIRTVYFTCHNLNGVTYPLHSSNPNTANLKSNTFAAIIPASGIILNGNAGNTNFSFDNTNSVDESNYFIGLEHGLQANQCNFEIYNCSFKNINNVSNTTTSGTAILCRGARSTTVPMQSLNEGKIGDINPTFGLTKFSNTFNDCRNGIYIVRDYGIIIKGNSLSNITHSGIEINNVLYKSGIVSNNTIDNYYFGIRIRSSPKLTSLIISNNNISYSLPNPTTNLYFERTAISISMRGESNLNGEIIFNEIQNARIGIYGNGINKVTCSNNRIYFDRDYASFISGKPHHGIWFEATNNLIASENHIEYLLPSSVTGTNIQQELRGFSLKGVTNSTIQNNIIKSCGRPIRVEGAFLGSQILCNTFDSCFKALLFTNADFTSIGKSGFSAANEWRNFPYGNINSTEPRIAGNIINGFNTVYFYNSGIATQNPNPSTCLNLLLINTTGNNGCSNSLTDSVPEYVDELAQDSIEAIDDDLAQERIRNAALLALINKTIASTNYQIWLQNMENTEAGIYGSLMDSAISREDCINRIEGFHRFDDPAFEFKRNLYLNALKMQIFPDSFFALDTSLLYQIANNNAWLETKAVYLARDLMGLEVDDEYNFLRSGNMLNNYDCNLLYTNSDDYVNITSDEPFTYKIIDYTGRTLAEDKTPINNFRHTRQSDTPAIMAMSIS
jgi:hypothetical protein